MAETIRLQGDDYQGVSIFRPVFKNARGERQIARTWYVRFRDHRGRRHEMPGFRHKRETLTLAQRVADLVHHRRVQRVPSTRLATYFDGVPEKTRACLTRWALLEEIERPPSLDGEIDSFEAVLAAKGTRTAGHRAHAVRRILGGYKEWSDVAPEEVERKIHTLGLSGSTANHYRQAVKQFGRHMARQRGCANPFADRIDKVKEVPVRVRRALTEEEIEKLLSSTYDEPERFDMSGPERRLFYKLAIETGFRLRELTTLKCGHLDLQADPPTIMVAAKHTKNGKGAVLPIQLDTAEELRRLLADRLPAARAFRCSAWLKGADMLYEDLDAAGIPRETPQGIVDFHALRTTCGTRLARGGVHPKQAQEFLRHSTVELTMRHYTKLGSDATRAALSALPSLGNDVG